MNNEILLFSESYDYKIVEIVLADFNIKKFDLKELKTKNCKNKNILVFLNDDNNINDLKGLWLYLNNPAYFDFFLKDFKNLSDILYKRF